LKRITLWQREINCLGRVRGIERINLNVDANDANFVLWDDEPKSMQIRLTAVDTAPAIWFFHARMGLHWTIRSRAVARRGILSGTA
jgi:hypothetical protein